MPLSLLDAQPTTHLARLSNGGMVHGRTLLVRVLSRSGPALQEAQAQLAAERRDLICSTKHEGELAQREARLQEAAAALERENEALQERAEELSTVAQALLDDKAALQAQVHIGEGALLLVELLSIGRRRRGRQISGCQSSGLLYKGMGAVTDSS